jgi:hypothetical protein
MAFPPRRSTPRVVIGDRWNVTAAEVGRRFPCDELIHDPAFEAWRGVTIDAPPEAVWPWVVQLRLAPYSYDWIDNLGRRSPQQLRGLPDPIIGENFTSVGGRPAGRILAVSAGEHLTGGRENPPAAQAARPQAPPAHPFALARRSDHGKTPITQSHTPRRAKRANLILAALPTSSPGTPALGFPSVAGPAPR